MVIYGSINPQVPKTWSSKPLRTSGREADAAEPRREAAFEPRLEPRRGSAAERMEPRLPAPVAERRRPGAEILGKNGERGKLLWLEEILHHLGWLKPYK